MASSNTRRIIQEEDAAFWDKVDRAIKDVWDEIMEEILQRSPPAEREAMYGILNWPEIQAMDPYLWAKLSADANSLAEKRRQEELARRQEMERQAFTNTKLLREQTQPLGIRPFSPDSILANFNQPLPLQ